MKDKNIGSSFDSWLREEGIYEDVSAAAFKRVLARQVAARAIRSVPLYGLRSQRRDLSLPPRGFGESIGSLRTGRIRHEYSRQNKGPARTGGAASDGMGWCPRSRSSRECRDERGTDLDTRLSGPPATSPTIGRRISQLTNTVCLSM